METTLPGNTLLLSWVNRLRFRWLDHTKKGLVERADVSPARSDDDEVCVGRGERRPADRHLAGSFVVCKWFFLFHLRKKSSRPPFEDIPHVWAFPAVRNHFVDHRMA
ncbi:hypothetical protein CDAR_126191 [Caerostris darwini]|uniref:Uncharacterized protein n=1 Tax=Caerostris darwini TaxID=1538125 RepID=A0AAV4SAL6_9ARAC|nr:hypothetical protein CDAR_126191 [Caerostris darwini]